MKYLLFVSLAFFPNTICDCSTCDNTTCDLRLAICDIQTSDNQSSDHLTSDLRFWLPDLRDSVKNNNYRITINTGKMDISGIWVVRQMNESWRGILMNEFGMKLFDFICTAKECKLMNVTTFANKWYIKKTIADDIRFILEIDNPCYKEGRTVHRSVNNDTLTITSKNKMLQRFANGEMVMYNKKRGLTYTFRKMED